MKIYITGIPGVGKSSLIKELKKRGMPAFDLDSIKGLCQWKNKKTGKNAKWFSGVEKDWFENYDQLCDKIKLKNLIKGKNKVFIAGLVSNQNNFLDLFDKIFLLRCKKRTFLKRILERKDNQFGKSSIEQKMLAEWHKEFEQDTMKKGAEPIDAEKSISDITKEILSKSG